jgi:hypothetical protein
MLNSAALQPLTLSYQDVGPTVDDLRILIKSLQDKLDELGPIVDILQNLQPMLSTQERIALNPDRTDPESLTRKHETPAKTPKPIP